MDNNLNEPVSSKTNKTLRAGLNIAAGAIPFAGGVLAAASSTWSEYEQDKVNEFLKYRQQMLENEIKEQLKTIHEIMQRLDKLGDVSERIKSNEFQSLVQRCFRDWSEINSEHKREYIRNILVNAASISISNDDVVRLFIDWIGQYSELHFQVIACIYRNKDGVSRGQIWKNIGKQNVREDSAEADLYKLLIRDLSTGGIIRQHRQTDYYGNFVTSQQPKSSPKKQVSHKIMESAFDMSKQYVLTELGQQFVHYAMSDVSIKLEHQDQTM